jgi:hypothetical protein
MLDVHAPHQSIQAWKGFWIHLGTISIGLLIALGLEQAVVALDHLHERHRLEADLQLEARKNLILMDIDNAYVDAMLAWLLQLRSGVSDLRESDGASKFVYLPAPNTKVLWSPDAPYWNSAKESAEVRLLPRDEAGMYDLVYAQQNFMKERGSNYRDALFRLMTFQARFANLEREEPGTDMSHMTTAQRIEVVSETVSKGPIVSRMSPVDQRDWYELVNDAVAELIRYQRSADIAYRVTQAVIRGAKSDEQLFKMLGGRPGDKSTAAPQSTSQESNQ